MSDDDVFRVLSQLQYDTGLILTLVKYAIAMLFVAGIAAVLTPILQRGRE